MTEQMCSAQIATRCNEEKSNAPKAKRLKSGRGSKGSVNALSARARFHFTNAARRFTISERIEHPKEARRRGERERGPPLGPKLPPSMFNHGHVVVPSATRALLKIAGCCARGPICIWPGNAVERLGPLL